MAVDFAIFQKSRHEGCKLVFGEVIAIIDKDALIRQSKNGLRIGNEHIGQLRRPWLSRRCGNDAVVDVLVVRHHGDLNLDALFDTNRVVENIDEIVERRIRLATVDVPDVISLTALFFHITRSPTVKNWKQLFPCWNLL